MKNKILKTICTIFGLFGVFIVPAAIFAYSQGVFTPLGEGAALLKVVSTIIRATFLILCTWAAWKRPKLVVWFALGALITFGIGGAADQIYKYGFINGFGKLIPTYYYVVFFHALFAFVAWLLTLNSGKEESRG